MILRVAHDPDILKIAQGCLVSIVLDKDRKRRMLQKRNWPKVGDALENRSTFLIHNVELVEILAL